MGDMGCRETRRELERYVDGECLQALTVEVETHLAGCTDCHDHAEFKRHMKLLHRHEVWWRGAPRGVGGADPPADPLRQPLAATESRPLP